MAKSWTVRYLNSLISSLISSIAFGEIPEKFETLELNPQNSRKNSKTQGKNSKLKGKTQGLVGIRLLRVPKWC